MVDANDRDAFRALWKVWKAGKGKEDADGQKAKLLATAFMLLGGTAEGHCPASLRYLRDEETRAETLERLRSSAGQLAADPVILFRGLRGGGLDDQSFRASKHISDGRLLSYSTTKQGGLTFAGMGTAVGLVYQLAVPVGDIVFFEDGTLCDDYPTEQEALVLHLRKPLMEPVTVTDTVPKRAKIGFGTKPAAHSGQVPSPPSRRAPRRST